MTYLDYGIPVLYLGMLWGIAWHFRKTSAAPMEFFLGGRNFKALPIGLSVMVTTFSAVNFLAFSGEVYGHGLYVLASLPVFFLAAIPITRWWIPFVLQKSPVSIYALLEERFDRRVRQLASGLFLIWRLCWMAVALYASCKIMSVLTGWDLTLLILLCGAVAACYSAVGGLRAVIWTDVMQFTVLIGSIAVAVIWAWHQADSGAILAEAGRLKPLYPVDWNYFSPDPRNRITLWSALIGTFVTFLTRYGADQMVMQRCLAAANPAAAKRGLWINAAASTLVLGLLVLFGLAVYLHGQRAGLPAGTPPVKVIASLLRSFPTGLPGLIGTGLLAATMSSIDSGVNSCSAAIKMDFPFFRTLSPKILTLILAALIIAASAWLLPEWNKNNTLFVILNKTVNAIGTPLLAMMLCIFWKKISAAALFYGGIAGIVLTVLSGFLLHNLALHYYAVLSLAVTLGATGLVQLFCRKTERISL